MLNPFMHLEMKVKQHKIPNFPIFRSLDLGEKCQLNVENLDYAIMGETWEGFRWLTQRSQYCTHMQMVSLVKNKYVTSMSTLQKAPRQRKGEFPTTVGGPKEIERILRGGIDNSNTFKGM
jgi:hypothetical protein